MGIVFGNKVCRSHHYRIAHQVSSLHLEIGGPRHFEPDFIPHVTEWLVNFKYPFSPAKAYPERYEESCPAQCQKVCQAQDTAGKSPWR